MPISFTNSICHYLILSFDIWYFWLFENVSIWNLTEHKVYELVKTAKIFKVYKFNFFR